MTEWMQLISLAFIAMFLALILKEQNAMFSFLVVFVAGLFILFLLLDSLHSIFSSVIQLSGRLNIEEPYIVLMMKLIGVAYIAEISAQLMKDAGFQALSYKIEVSGKILIITMAMPIITALIETFVQMVQSFL